MSKGPKGVKAALEHLNPIQAYHDPRLTECDVIWAAAGTPHHIFLIAPDQLIKVTGAQSADFTD